MAKRRRDATDAAAAAAAIRWSKDTEDKFVELWQQHPCLFDVSSREYHDRVKKDQCWRGIAEALQQPVAEVQTKAASLRTQYGKLLRPKPSGSGDKEPTARQRWIVRNLKFLRPFVAHRASQITLNVDDIVTIDAMEEGGDDQETEEDVSESSTSTLPPSTRESSAFAPSALLNSPESASSQSSPMAARQNGRAHKSKKRSKGRGSDDLEMEKVAILKTVSQTLLGASQDIDETFGRHVVSEMRQIKDPATKTRLRRDILVMMYDAQETEQRASSHPLPQSTTQPMYTPRTPWQAHASSDIQPSEDESLAVQSVIIM